MLLNKILNLVVITSMYFSIGFARAADIKNIELEIWKSPTCGCCEKWAQYMASHKFNIKTNNVTHGVLAKIKKEAGLAPQYASCHTAKINGYIIEGHVPVQDVKRLLLERPDAVGLSVPGMPIGSPGMEHGDEKEPYEVLLIKKDGTSETFSKKPGKG